MQGGRSGCAGSGLLVPEALVAGGLHASGLIAHGAFIAHGTTSTREPDTRTPGVGPRNAAV